MNRMPVNLRGGRLLKLNQRLANGGSASPLLTGLHALPKVLAGRFQAEPGQRTEPPIR